MKHYNAPAVSLTLGLVLASILLLLPANGTARGSGYGHGGQANQAGQQVITPLPAESLSPEEQAGLRWMREEEKLARDVYRVLHEQWNDQVFANITLSEQRHMDSVKTLLDRYSLPDPVQDDSTGIFTDPVLQELFSTLIARGEQSLTEALQVGATIEDLDLSDLQEELEKTEHADIQQMYEHLARGSRNHLRAFTSALASYGETYQAQYLSEEEVEAIISSPRERGPMGSGMGAGNGGQGRGRQSGAQSACRLLTR